MLILACIHFIHSCFAEKEREAEKELERLRQEFNIADTDSEEST